MIGLWGRMTQMILRGQVARNLSVHTAVVAFAGTDRASIAGKAELPCKTRREDVGHQKYMCHGVCCVPKTVFWIHPLDESRAMLTDKCCRFFAPTPWCFLRRVRE